VIRNRKGQILREWIKEIASLSSGKLVFAGEHKNAFYAVFLENTLLVVHFDPFGCKEKEEVLGKIHLQVSSDDSLGGENDYWFNQLGNAARMSCSLTMIDKTGGVVDLIPEIGTDSIAIPFGAIAFSRVDLTVRLFGRRRSSIKAHVVIEGNRTSLSDRWGRT
jgi:hypothetical protein